MTRVSRGIGVCVVLLTGALLAGGQTARGQGNRQGQVTFEDTLEQLKSLDWQQRLKAVRLLKGAAYPESAVPLARAVTDTYDEVQLEAIAAELNIFLEQKVTPKKRVGLLVEVRGSIAAEPIFSAGPSMVGPGRVPPEVAAALASATRDPSARVAVEALYAFGVLAPEVPVASRAAMLHQAGPLLAASIGNTDPALRVAALRVFGRVFVRKPGDLPVDESVGDAIILALNDREATIKTAAMWTLGAMRYERAVQGLTELFNYHQRGPIAEAAFDALAHIAHPASLTQFVAQLNGKDQSMKMLAIEGLARIGDPARSDTIQLALTDEKSEEILLAGHFANVRLANGPAEAIVQALSRNKLRNQAFGYVTELAIVQPSALTRYLPDPDTRIRLDLLDAMGQSTDPKVLPALEPFMRDKDANVARVAARAAARVRGTATR
jgi:HEAT repeat protein